MLRNPRHLALIAAVRSDQLLLDRAEDSRSDQPTDRKRRPGFNEPGPRPSTKTQPKNDGFTTIRHGPVALSWPHDESEKVSDRRSEIDGIDGIKSFAAAVLNRLTQGVIIVDAESRPLFVNQAAEGMAAESDGL